MSKSHHLASKSINKVFEMHHYYIQVTH